MRPRREVCMRHDAWTRGIDMRHEARARSHGAGLTSSVVYCRMASVRGQNESPYCSDRINEHHSSVSAPLEVLLPPAMLTYNCRSTLLKQTSSACHMLTYRCPALLVLIFCPPCSHIPLPALLALTLPPMLILSKYCCSCT
jgi:hypothetical protein